MIGFILQISQNSVYQSFTQIINTNLILKKFQKIAV